MKHLMVDLATLLVSGCSICVSLVFWGVCGSSELAKALQLAAQPFSMATVTAAGAQARVLTLAGLTAICIAHSIHSKVSAEADF